MVRYRTSQLSGGLEDRREVVLDLGGQVELPADLAEDVHELGPLRGLDVQMLVGHGHGAPGVPLRPAEQITHELRDEELEA